MDGNKKGGGRCGGGGLLIVFLGTDRASRGSRMWRKERALGPEPKREVREAVTRAFTPRRACRCSQKCQQKDLNAG